MKTPRFLTALVLACLPGCASLPMRSPQPLERAHAHNDYLHERPLLDALQNGFCSVEADIHLVHGQLLVAHDLEDVSPQRTLEFLYLNPLREQVRRHKGRVYPNGPVFTLLIDIKSEAEPTYRALHGVLENYADMLTRFEAGQPARDGAVVVIVSGNRSRDHMAGQSVRYAAMDGRLPDLDADPPVDLVPLISDNWGNHFTWRGDGAFPESERARLDAWVARTHAQGRRLRFWAVPDQPAAWAVLREAGVDLINTDDLAGLREFLTAQ